MSPLIELVYFEGCPHVEATRTALREALGATGQPLRWREWRTDDPALPPYAVGFGSPSVFIERREATGSPAGSSGAACRVYRSPDGTRGSAPDPAVIAALLESLGQ
jgi:hypothetical protein